MLLNTENADCGNDGDYVLDIGDRWIISRLQETEREVEAAFAAYRFDLASQALYRFVWDEYCSWYLEWSKTVLAHADPLGARGTRRTLLRVLETALRLLHPLMPFITETLWGRIAPLCARGRDTIMRAPYPRCDERRIDAGASAAMQTLMGIVSAVRTIRGEMNVSPAARIPVLLDGARDHAGLIKDNERTICALAKIAEITLLDGAAAPEAAVALVGAIRVLVPLAGLIDKTAELKRLAKELEKIDREIERARVKLERPDFIARAPAAVVDEERRRLADFCERRDKLAEQEARIAALEA